MRIGVDGSTWPASAALCPATAEGTWRVSNAAADAAPQKPVARAVVNAKTLRHLERICSSGICGVASDRLRRNLVANQVQLVVRPPIRTAFFEGGPGRGFCTENSARKYPVNLNSTSAFRIQPPETTDHSPFFAATAKCSRSAA